MPSGLDHAVGSRKNSIRGVSRGRTVSDRGASSGRSPHGGLYLLFRKGERPDSARVSAVVQGMGHISVSHVPEAGENARAGATWLELLIDGMTFDLLGLTPGKPADLPETNFRFDCPAGFELESHSALLLVPGPHLLAGANSQPVVRSQAALGTALLDALPGSAALIWGPSQAVMGADYFRSTVAAWLAGGPFPALGLTAFRETLDNAIQSVGLAHFTGQEVRLEPALAADRADAVRLAIRLVDQLVSAGKLERRERITAPDGGTLRLEPSANGRFVRVFPN